MIDFYSQTRADLRTTAFFHPGTQTSWPELFKQYHNADPEAGSHHTYLDSPLSVFAASLTLHWRRWQAEIWPSHSKRVRVHRYTLPLKHRSQIHR